MSRIGQRPIKIPKNVEVDISGSTLSVKGSKGEHALDLPDGISVVVDETAITVKRERNNKKLRALHGTIRSLIANMVEGVVNGFVRDLEISGVGYRAQVQGRKLVLESGFSHDIEYEPPEGVAIESPNGTEVKVSGIDKHKVGQVAARIRAYCQAEPYKGKGICYKDERVRRKVGKTVA